MPQKQQKQRLPGFSFEERASLVYDNNRDYYQTFGDSLLIAIFWEETMFNNVAQEQGTAVGLGQIEPAELWTLKQYGITTNAKNILNSPAHAVKVTAAYLNHLYQSQTANPKRRSEALKRYAGYCWDKAAWRLTLIQGWEACAQALDNISAPVWSDNPEAVLNALALARGFSKSDPKIRAALFP